MHCWPENPAKTQTQEGHWVQGPGVGEGGHHGGHTPTTLGSLSCKTPSVLQRKSLTFGLFCHPVIYAPPAFFRVLREGHLLQLRRVELPAGLSKGLQTQDTAVTRVSDVPTRVDTPSLCTHLQRKFLLGPPCMLRLAHAADKNGGRRLGAPPCASWRTPDLRGSRSAGRNHSHPPAATVLPARGRRQPRTRPRGRRQTLHPHPDFLLDYLSARYSFFCSFLHHQHQP